MYDPCSPSLRVGRGEPFPVDDDQRADGQVTGAAGPGSGDRGSRGRIPRRRTAPADAGAADPPAGLWPGDDADARAARTGSPARGAACNAAQVSAAGLAPGAGGRACAHSACPARIMVSGQERQFPAASGGRRVSPRPSGGAYPGPRCRWRGLAVPRLGLARGPAADQAAGAGPSAAASRLKSCVGEHFSSSRMSSSTWAAAAAAAPRSAAGGGARCRCRNRSSGRVRAVPASRQVPPGDRGRRSTARTRPGAGRSAPGGPSRSRAAPRRDARRHAEEARRSRPAPGRANRPGRGSAGRRPAPGGTRVNRWSSCSP